MKKQRPQHPSPLPGSRRSRRPSRHLEWLPSVRLSVWVCLNNLLSGGRSLTGPTRSHMRGFKSPPLEIRRAYFAKLQWKHIWQSHDKQQSQRNTGVDGGHRGKNIQTEVLGVIRDVKTPRWYQSRKSRNILLVLKSSKWKLDRRTGRLSDTAASVSLRTTENASMQFR